MTHRLPFALPRTIEWLTQKLDLRARLRLRSVLRDVERTCDARLVVLWVSEGYAHKSVLEFAGDDSAMPARFPELTSSVPSREVVRDTEHEEHDAAVFRIRIGGDAPTIGAAIIVPGVLESGRLFDALELAGEHVEEIVVDSVERMQRAASPRRRARSVSGPAD